MQLTVEKHSRPLAQPFSITGHTFTNLNAVWVRLEQDGHIGRGEGCGVYYLGETQDSMIYEIESVRTQIEAGIDRKQLQQLLPAGGARNALDCALWDLECKTVGKSIWEQLSIAPKQLKTVATIGIGSADEMAKRAMEFSSYENLKIKLDATEPIAKLKAIRAARPDAALVIDVNQGWDFDLLVSFLPELEKLDIAMIEQPLPRGADEQLGSLHSNIPIGGDESVLNLAEYQKFKDRYQVINIKLDKCGGLTEALEIAKAATNDGKSVMVGNMTGTSLSMAPSYVIGQYCEFVDIDGPVLLAQDIENGLSYQAGGLVSIPSPELWG